MGVTSACEKGFLLASLTSSAYSILDMSCSTSASHHCAVGIWGNHPLQSYPVNPFPPSHPHPIWRKIIHLSGPGHLPRPALLTNPVCAGRRCFSWHGEVSWIWTECRGSCFVELVFQYSEHELWQRARLVERSAAQAGDSAQGDWMDWWLFCHRERESGLLSLVRFFFPTF